MKSHNISNVYKTGILLAAFLLLGAFLAPQAQAQFTYKWLAAGSFHDAISSGGGQDEANSFGMVYPGIYEDRSMIRSKGLWIHAKNWNSGDTEFPEKTYTVKGIHRGPREPGYGQLFGIDLTLYGKFTQPVVSVNGLQSFLRPVTVDVEAPNMKADQMMYNKVNTALGLTIERWVRQFSQQDHDNYHIIEYKFTNTGNADAAEGAELDTTLEDVYITFLNRYSLGDLGPSGTSWGRNTMNDVVGDGNKDYSADITGNGVDVSDMRAVYSWLGHQPSWGATGNTIGAPQLNNQPADTVGRLGSAWFIGRATLHADVSVDDRDDDPSQPATTSMIDSDHPYTTAADMFNEDAMINEYAVADTGHIYPYHADVVENPPPANEAPGGVFDPDEWRNRFAFQYGQPDYETLGGFQSIIAYGPYDIPFNDSIRIVQVLGADGISWEGAYDIGAGYKDAYDTYGHPDADTVGIEWNDTEMTKGEWVMTGRDSLMEMFDAAKKNWESGYNIPEPPKPPATFDVNTSPNQIELSWTTFEGEPDPESWIIWRGKFSVDSVHVPVDTLPGSRRSYSDVSDDDGEPVRGINYYYYIQALGSPISSDPTGVTEPGTQLVSSRYWTQTYAPAQLKRHPGSALDSIRVVPNPFNLASESSVRWPDRQDKMAFLNVPGQCTIKIYTESGELVETLEHTDGSGDQYWSMTTSSNQLVVSGIYFAVITETTSGDQVIKKFTVIR